MTPEEEERVRADERRRVKALEIDTRLQRIDRKLEEYNGVRTDMVTKGEFQRFEERHEERLQEFMHQARNIFIVKREAEEHSQRWHDRVWVRFGIAGGIIVSLSTVVQAAVFLYLTLTRH